MGNLKLDALAANNGPIFAPVELERFPWLEYQRHKSAAPRRLLGSVPIITPSASKSRNAFIGSAVSQLHQIRVHLLHCPPLFARLARLDQKPG